METSCGSVVTETRHINQFEIIILLNAFFWVNYINRAFISSKIEEYTFLAEQLCEMRNNGARILKVAHMRLVEVDIIS